MPIIIIKRFNSLEHGNSVEEAIAVAPDGFSAKNYVDHLNRQQSLLQISIQRFIDIQRHVRSIFPAPENESLKLIPKWRIGIKEEEITTEMRQERSEIKLQNDVIKKENARKNKEWQNQYRSKVIELASSWIKDFPSDIISSFQEFGQLPSIIQPYYFYKEVPYAEY